MPKTLSNAELIHVPLKHLSSAFNLRSKAGSVVTLKKSIDDLGLIHPIVVTDRADLCQRVGSKYVVIAGSRRVAATKLLRWSKIPARIAPNDDVDSIMQIQTDENEQRSDLDAYDASIVRYNAVLDEVQRLIAESGGKDTHASRVARIPQARVNVGISRDTVSRDKRIIGIVKRYPELERWGRKPLMAAAEVIDETPVSERADMRRFLGSFEPRSASEGIKAARNLIDRWIPADRKKLLKHAKTDPEGAQQMALDVPPCPDERLVELGLLCDVLKELMKQYPRRDDARREMAIARGHLDEAHKYLRNAYEAKKDEFSQFIEG